MSSSPFGFDIEEVLSSPDASVVNESHNTNCNPSNSTQIHPDRPAESTSWNRDPDSGLQEPRLSLAEPHSVVTVETPADNQSCTTTHEPETNHLLVDHYNGIRRKTREQTEEIQQDLDAMGRQASLPDRLAAHKQRIVLKHSKDLKPIDVILRYNGGNESKCVGIGTTTWRGLTKPEIKTAGQAHFEAKFADLCRDLRLSEQQRNDIAFVTWINPRDEPDLVGKVFELIQQGVPTFKFKEKADEEMDNETVKKTKFFRLATLDDIRVSMGYRSRTSVEEPAGHKRSHTVRDVQTGDATRGSHKKKQNRRETTKAHSIGSLNWFSQDVNEEFFRCIENDFAQLLEDYHQHLSAIDVPTVDLQEARNFEEEVNRQKQEYYRRKTNGDSFFDLYVPACRSSLKFRWALMESALEETILWLASCKAAETQTRRYQNDDAVNVMLFDKNEDIGSTNARVANEGTPGTESRER